MAVPRFHRARVAAFGGIAALCVALPVGASSAPSADLARVERAQRAAAAQAQSLTARAVAEAQAADPLHKRLSEVAQFQAQTIAALSTLEAHSAMLAELAAEASVTAQSKQQAFESAFAAVAFGARAGEPSARRTLTAVALTAGALGNDFAADHQRLSSLQARQAQTQEAIVALSAARTTLLETTASLERLALAHTQAAAQFESQAAQAQARAQRLAREARDLRTLISRASAQGAAGRRAASGASVPRSWATPIRAGEILHQYGADLGGGRAARGVTLSVAADGNVFAPASGQIAFADNFRDFGRVVIVDTDDGYVIVLAGLSSLQVSAGGRVASGELVGEMPQSNNRSPELYVEVRVGDQTISPNAWLGAIGAQ